MGFFAQLVFVPLLFLAALLTPLWLPIVMGFTWLSEKAFIHRMKRRGRYLEWRLVSERLSKGEGTVIIDEINKLPARVWWTAEEVASLSPHPLPSSEELPYLPLPDLPPFVAWCYARYLNPDNGTAVLTSTEEIKATGLFLAPSHIQERFPRARVCVTQRTV